MKPKIFIPLVTSMVFGAFGTCIDIGGELASAQTHESAEAIEGDTGSRL